MEDALALASCQQESSVELTVLILVLMEDALARMARCVPVTRLIVLILVLMEDALARSDSEDFGKRHCLS